MSLTPFAVFTAAHTAAKMLVERGIGDAQVDTHASGFRIEGTSNGKRIVYVATFHTAADRVESLVETANGRGRVAKKIGRGDCHTAAIIDALY